MSLAGGQRKARAQKAAPTAGDDLWQFDHGLLQATSPLKPRWSRVLFLIRVKGLFMPAVGVMGFRVRSGRLR